MVRTLEPSNTKVTIILTFIPATQRDIDLLAPTVRRADVEECLAVAGVTVHHALVKALEESPIAVTVYTDEAPIAMFGCGGFPGDPKLGIPWMVTTDAITQYKRELLKLAPMFIETMQEFYPTLTNVVDTRNHLHVSWLKRMGFRFIGVGRFGVDKSVPFIHFIRTPQ